MLVNDSIISKYYINFYEKLSIHITEFIRNNSSVKKQIKHKISTTCFVSYKNLSHEYSHKYITDLSMEILQEIKDIDMLLIGTGERHSFPKKELYVQLTQLNYSIDFMDTHAACRTFNILSNENRKVAALLFL